MLTLVIHKMVQDNSEGWQRWGAASPIGDLAGGTCHVLATAAELTSLARCSNALAILGSSAALAHICSKPDDIQFEPFHHLLQQYGLCFHQDRVRAAILPIMSGYLH